MSKAPAVDYALKIIEFLAGSNGEVGISDICNGLNINKNATSRVLDALMEQKWIYLSNAGQKKYRLTMKPFSVITKSIEKNNVVKISRPYLEQIHSVLGDSVYLGIKKDDKVLYELHFDSVKDVRINGCVGGEYSRSFRAQPYLLSTCIPLPSSRRQRRQFRRWRGTSNIRGSILLQTF